MVEDGRSQWSAPNNTFSPNNTKITQLQMHRFWAQIAEAQFSDYTFCRRATMLSTITITTTDHPQITQHVHFLRYCTTNITLQRRCFFSKFHKNSRCVCLHSINLTESQLHNASTITYNFNYPSTRLVFSMQCKSLSKT